MDDDRKRPHSIDQVSAQTSDRVAEMSDEERVELARNIFGRRDVGADGRGGSPIAVPYTAGGKAPLGTDEDVAAEVARLSAELARTERRILRMERSVTRSRYQMVPGDGKPTGRYARLLHRAERLERQLRSLK